MSFVTYLAASAFAGIVLLICYLLAKTALIVAIISLAAMAMFAVCLTPKARADMAFTPFVFAAVMPVSAWLLPNIWLLYGLMIMLLWLSPRAPGQVPALYLFALLLLPGLDQSVALGAIKLFDFGIHDALACGALLALLTHPAWRARTAFQQDLPFVIFGLMLVVALSRNTSPTNMLRVACTLSFDFALPYFIITRGVRDRYDLQRCMLYLAAAGTILSALLIYEAAHGWPIYNVLLERFGFTDRPAIKMRGAFLRAGGPFLESTSAAMVLVFCFLAGWMARSSFQSRFHHWAILLVLLVGLIPPQSRGAWAGLLTGMVLADLYLGRYRQTILKVVLMGMAGLALFVAAASSPQLSEMLGQSGGSVDTVDYRAQLFDRGMEEFWHSPIFGFAYPELLRRLSDLRQGEGIVDFVNTHLFIALLAGVVGLAIFNGTIFYHLLQIWRSRRQWRAFDDTQRRAGAFALAALGTPVQMLLFTSLGGRVQVLLVVFIGFAIAAVRPRAQTLTPNTIAKAAFAIRPIAIPAVPAPSSNSSSSGFRMPSRDNSIQP